MTKIKPKECLRVIQNLFATPKYTKLKLGMRAYIKLMCYCHLAGELEITGLGRIKDGEIIDFKIPYQEVTGTTAEASDEAIINLMREIPIEEIKEWELDWHSHVDMQAFISPTDEANYELMSMARGGNQFPLMVVNKRGEFCVKNFIHEGKCPAIELELQGAKISNKEIEKIYNSCKSEVAERVSMKQIKTTLANEYTHYQGSFGNYWNGYSSKKEDGIEIDTVDAETYGMCRSCGVQLVSAEEFENGLCDDCIGYWSSYKNQLVVV